MTVVDMMITAVIGDRVRRTVPGGAVQAFLKISFGTSFLMSHCHRTARDMKGDTAILLEVTMKVRTDTVALEEVAATIGIYVAMMATGIVVLEKMILLYQLIRHG